MPSMLNADLHSHSLISDGALSPEALAQRASANGVQLWSLTDHDELSGLEHAQAAALAAGMSFVSGVEISTTWAGRTVHIVGLGVDVSDGPLNEGLQRIRDRRIGRARQIAERLEAMGVPDSYEGARRHAANPRLLSRMHFARHLIDVGRSSGVQQAFDTYLGEGRPANVRVHWATLEEAVGWILGAGGRAVIAHPGRYPFNDTEESAFFDAFTDLGGTGVEVVTGSHRSEQYQRYARLARHHGLMASRGSDFHTPAESRIDLGRLPPLPDGLTPIWNGWV